MPCNHNGQKNSNFVYANYPYFPNLLFPTFLIYCLDDFYETFPVEIVSVANFSTSNHRLTRLFILFDSLPTNYCTDPQSCMLYNQPSIIFIFWIILLQYLFSFHVFSFSIQQYAVKAQTSLAPLSWFPGSHIPTAHVHQCCRFQSYANSHAIAYEIYKRNLQSVNHIPGIHDNGRPVTFDFNSVLNYSM